jgi:hypothetical protein
LPQSTALRLGVSPIWRAGRVFARADFGLDIDAGADGRRYDTALRFNVGIGVIVDEVALTAEMTNAYDYTPTASATSEPSGASWIDTAAVAVRFLFGHVEPYGAIVFPLDADSHQIMELAATVGLEVR